MNFVGPSTNQYLLGCLVPNHFHSEKGPLNGGNGSLQSACNHRATHTRAFVAAPRNGYVFRRVAIYETEFHIGNLCESDTHIREQDREKPVGWIGHGES